MFSCNFCQIKTNTLQEHLIHQNFHRNLSSSTFCGFKNCSKSFKNVKHLRTHLIRCHNFYSSKCYKKQRVSIANAEGKYVCTVAICGQVTDDYGLLLKHLKKHIKSNVEVTCPHRRCDKKYSKIKSFTGHLSKYHMNSAFVYNNRFDVENIETDNNGSLDVSEKST